MAKIITEPVLLVVFIRSLELWRSDGSVSQLSATQQPELLSATIGGLGPNRDY